MVHSNGKMNGTNDDTERTDRPKASIRAKVEDALRRTGRDLAALHEHLNGIGVQCSLQTVINRLEGSFGSRDVRFFPEVANFLEVSYDELMDSDAALDIPDFSDPGQDKKMLKRAMVRIVADENWNADERDAVMRILLRLVDGDRIF